MRYPIDLTRDDNETWLVTSPDFPELTTFGEDEAEAAIRARDALVTVIADRIAHREPVPVPSPVDAASTVLGHSETLKVLLYQAMMRAGIGKAGLARRLNCHLPQIDRLLDLHHASTIGQLENAWHAAGIEIEVSARAAA